ncbi:MAG: cadherin domain-containing protein, partial [Planctomycetota bacterium]|nr:cadherin domain-containing protein [Planctomycetota bacterium]
TGGGSLTNSDTATINITAVNDAPTISALGNQTIAEDGTTGALAFSVSDVETAAGSLTVTASSSNTTIIPNGNLTLVDLGGGNWTIEATPALNQNGGPVTITVTVDDGTTTTDETFDVTVTAVNDAPVNQVPETQVTSVDVPVTFNATNGNAISITEVDSASSPINVSLTGYNGTLTLSTTTGLTFNSGDGTADGAMDFTGTVADINTALDGLVFTPDSGFEGAAGLTIGTDDQGNTGLGGVQGDKSAVFVSVGALTFQQGTNGYSGNEDTELQEATPATSFGNATSISIDLDNGGAESQGLIQFSNLFGSGAGQIPFGSTIDSASLTVYAFDTSVSATTISLHEMLTSWDETSTWNSATNGLQRDDVEVSSAVDSTMTFADFTGPQTFFGLESTLQSWSDGATNNGWAVFTDSVDGWDFYSSEYATVDRRPALTISFTAPQPSSIDLDANDSSGQAGANFAAAFTEDGGPVAIADVDASILDTDSSSLISLTVTITNLLDGAAEVLAADTSGTAIGAFYDSGTGVLTLSGSDSLSNYQQVLRSVIYDNTSQSPNETARNITFVVNDSYRISNTATSTVSVAGVNDAPTISPATFGLPENSANSTAVGTVTFSDPDVGDARAFLITSGNTGGAFNIDSNGNLFVANSVALDFETTPTFNLTVRITDGAGLFDEAAVTVNLTDENDNAPVIDAAQSFIISEAAANLTTVGTATATDADTVGTLQSWMIIGGNTDGIFAINAATGEITVADNTNLDYETTTLHTLTLTVGDGVNTSASETVVINVTDENEAPISAISDTDATTEEVAENQPAATSVGITAFANDPDGTDTVSYSLDDDAGGRFTIDNVSGVIRTTGPLDAETATSHSITVRATSDDGSTTTQGYMIAINDLDEFDITAISDTDS